MTRSQCDTLSADVLRIYSDMEDEILRMIAAQIGRDGDLSDTSRWRIRQLARSGQMNAKTAALIASYTGVQADAVYDTVLEAAKKEISYLDEAVQASNEKGITEYLSDIPAEDSALFAAQSFQEQAANDLNLVNTVMQYKAKSSYVDAINGIYYDASKRQAALDTMGKGAALAVSGQTSLQEATRRTIHNLAQKGIPAFVDKRGREWSPEAYVMMDMRSTLANTARAAQDMRCDQYGIQLIAVSSHMGARPKCAPYQGGIFSRDGSSGVTVDGAGNQVKYSPLSQTSYGEPDGLFGINCGHVQYPFIPGVNIQRYFPYNEEQNAQRYEEFQRQRSMERDIKATKRECMMLQAAGDEEGLKQASQKLRQQKQKYNQFCNDKNLGTHYDRTQVYGYDRSKSAKTVWAERKLEANKNNIDYMSKSFKPQFGSEKSIETTIDSGTFSFDVKQVLNSKFELLVPVETNRRDKSIRSIEKILRESLDDLPIPVDLPPIAIVDFDDINPNAIGGYDHKSGILFINKKYDTVEKMLEYVNEIPGMFANTTVSAPLKHEIGHKFYYDSIKALAKKKNMSYNDAMELFDNTIKEHIHNRSLDKKLYYQLSEYAQNGFNPFDPKYTEVIAECYSVYGQNEIATNLIDELLEMITDEKTY